MIDLDESAGLIGAVLQWLAGAPPVVWYSISGAVIVILVMFQIVMMRRYKRLAERASERPNIAPVTTKGAISKELRSAARSQLDGEFQAVRQTYERILHKPGFLNTPVSIGREFGAMMELAIASLNVTTWEQPDEFRLEDDLKNILVKAKFFEARLGTIVKLLSWLVHRVPAPYRRRYMTSLIHVLLVSVGEEAQIQIFRSDGSESPAPVDDGDPDPKPPMTLTHITAIQDQDYNLLRDAAFMILQVHGKTFPGLDWQSMRDFTDGMDALDVYRRTADPDAAEEKYSEAKKCFRQATVADPNHHEAFCFLGSMLVAERTEESIGEAIRFFTHALETPRLEFRAFVNAGLAHCYAQQWHRLARRQPSVLAKARKHAADALRDCGTTEPDPWIRYTQALVIIIDEGSDCQTPEELKQHFVPAITECRQAIKAQPENSLFHNTLGWMLLKLVERGVAELTTQDGAPQELVGNAARKAKVSFKRSIELSSANKLSHANLCLLYATEHFRQDKPQYLPRCEFYGLESLNIDPNYINGYRDLAVSMLRYGEVDRAYPYFEKALDLSHAIEKDQEIIADALRVLQTLEGVTDQEMQRWREPNPELLKPPPAHSLGGWRRRELCGSTDPRFQIVFSFDSCGLDKRPTLHHATGDIEWLRMRFT